MSLLVILALAAAFIIILSISTKLFFQQKKSESRSGYTYWFENVDEIFK